MSFEDATGPTINVVASNFSNPNCGMMSHECDFIEGMEIATQSIDYGQKHPARLYAGKTVCSGLRPRTEEERKLAEDNGKDPESQVCGIEILVARDF